MLLSITDNKLMKDRVILHCDMNSFFCSVELLDHPELADKPVAVAGGEELRHGIILAKNTLAKKMGVTTPEPIFQARKKCPDLVLLEPHYEKYSYFCKLINSIYLQYTDLVEPFSIDESWLDVTGSLSYFHKTGKELADEIRERVYKETGLTLSAGVSFNKTFAKMGSDYKKPFATTEITRDNFKDILWPLPAGDLFFVGKSSAQKLYSMNIKTIGDIAQSDEKRLSLVFGKHGLSMKAMANGSDSEPVLPYDTESKAKSVGNGITFRRDIRGEEEIKTAVTAISDRVAVRLRKHNLRCRGVKVDIKNPEFVSISRQMMLGFASNVSSEIAAAAMEIFKNNWYMDNPIRLITITAISLLEAGEESTEQLSLFDSKDKEENREKDRALENTMDAIRSKMGKGSITKASLIGNDMGIIIDDH